MEGSGYFMLVGGDRQGGEGRGYNAEEYKPVPRKLWLKEKILKAKLTVY